MEGNAMDQLSGGDSVFLAMETPGAPQHVGGLVLLDRREAADFDFEKLLRVVDERIRLAPRFTRRLREVAGGLDRAWLVDDADFDVRRHLHRIAVPAPGSMRELAELVGFLFAPPLDRSRPLWEMWWIEGVGKNRVALLMKSHHCLMDGVAGASMGALLCDMERQPSRPPEAAASEPAPEPSDLAVALRATRNLLSKPAATLRLGRSLLGQGLGALRSLRDPDAAPLPLLMPRVSFNGNPGPRRAFACASVSLAAVKEIRKRFDVTVNDVVLALTGGAVRRYLEERGELPKKSLIAVIAVSTRAEGDNSLGNQVTAVGVPWGTDRADPVARLLRIHRAAEKAKSGARQKDAQLLAHAGDALLPGFLGFVMKNFGAAGAALGMPGNAVVSNVRGTPVPLYIGGARMESMYPLSILAPTQGLNVTAVSYCGKIDVGFTVDPDLVPDPWRLAEGIPLALEELRVVA
jgi:WS/DGAT/MGAT family acyltransferase